MGRSSGHRASRAIYGIVALAVLLTAVSASAREEESGGRGGGAVIYISGGAHAPDRNALDARLRATGYDALPDRAYSLGGGAVLVRGRFLLGGEGYALFAQESSGGGRTATFDGGYWLVNLGAEIARFRRMTVYAMGGIGRGGSSLKLTEGGSLPFDSVLASPRREAYLSSSGLSCFRRRSGRRCFSRSRAGCVPGAPQARSSAYTRGISGSPARIGNSPIRASPIRRMPGSPVRTSGSPSAWEDGPGPAGRLPEVRGRRHCRSPCRWIPIEVSGRRRGIRGRRRPGNDARSGTGRAPPRIVRARRASRVRRQARTGGK